MRVMKSDAEKIADFTRLTDKGDDTTGLLEAVGVALSIDAEDDRDFYLLKAAELFLACHDWQRAHGITELMTESYEKAETLRRIAEFLPSIGHLERSLAVFSEAETASTAKLLAAWQQAELLNLIANSLDVINARIRADEVRARAISTARSGQDSPSAQDRLDAASVLAEIAENLAAKEKIEDAMQVAQTISNLNKRTWVVNQISEYSSNVKRVA